MARLLAVERTSIEYGSFADEDARFGPSECSGKHQTNSDKYPDTETEGGRDKFKRKSTTGLPIPNVTPGEPVVFAGWNSDCFFFVRELTVEAKTISGKASRTGKALTQPPTTRVERRAGLQSCSPARRL
jgi:hypothetical protein